MKHYKPRVLFIVKKRNDSYGPSFGLMNSCKFIANALNDREVEAKVVDVVDNNDINKEVTDFKPTHVFIEALWVVPAKFEELIPLHPHVQWYIRIHSKIPFIANEGIAIEWLRGYNALSDKFPNLHIAANNLEMLECLHQAFHIRGDYYPNIYAPDTFISTPKVTKPNNVLDIGCFGVIRPLKNQLIQGLAAIAFGNQLGKKVRFHINADRVEQKGDAVLKNLINAMADTGHELVEHPWLPHDDFIRLVRTMDLGMQVSLSETFNIVAADFVWNGVPLVGSNEIEWLSSLFQADTSDIDKIVNKLYVAYYGKKIGLQNLNLWNLNDYNNTALRIWLQQL